jgi:hypothetical protein
MPIALRHTRTSGTPKAKRHALDAVTAFQTVYGAKFPKSHGEDRRRS